MSKPNGECEERAEATGSGGKRSWRVSFAASALVVGASLSISAVLNPVIGRTVHWDWAATLASVLLVALTLALRQRWI